MMNLLKFFPTLFFASFVAAQLTITKPSSTLWWVADAENEIIWTCSSSPYANWTVLLDNPSFTAPVAFIAIQQNTQCSIDITANQVNQPAGSGYQILFANTLNNTDVYASSEPFVIQPPGSAYPTAVTSSGAGTSATSSGSSPSPSVSVSTTKSGTVHLKAGLGAVSLAALGIALLFT